METHLEKKNENEMEGFKEGNLSYNTGYIQ